MNTSGTNSPIATLTIRNRSQGEWTVPLHDGQSLRVGREEGNDICLDDQAASRLHAIFSASLTGVVIADASSTNGTFVNGERIIALQDLTSADVVDIGTTKITIQIHTDEATKALSSRTSSRAMTAQMKPIPVTVLVTGVTNYQQLASHAGVKNFSLCAKQWQEQVHTIVATQGGKIDKIIGGRIVAVWIGGVASEISRAACTAALRIRDAGREFSSDTSWKTDPQLAWKTTVVCSSGLGLKGGRPGGSGGDFTVLGDPTSIAFKLESLVGKLGEEVILCEYTASLVKTFWVLRKVIHVKVRGDEAIAVYSID